MINKGQAAWFGLAWLPVVCEKEYLSAVRSLHIEQGFPDPLSDCHRLQRVVPGIKRVQGAVMSQRLPITNCLLATIFRALDMNAYDHCMFWAACTLGYILGSYNQQSLQSQTHLVFLQHFT